MKKVEGYNRNLMYGRRPHKGITKIFNADPKAITNLSRRLIVESKAFASYRKRVGQK